MFGELPPGASAAFRAFAAVSHRSWAALDEAATAAGVLLGRGGLGHAPGGGGLVVDVGDGSVFKLTARLGVRRAADGAYVFGDFEGHLDLALQLEAFARLEAAGFRVPRALSGVLRGTLAGAPVALVRMEKVGGEAGAVIDGERLSAELLGLLAARGAGVEAALGLRRRLMLAIARYLEPAAARVEDIGRGSDLHPRNWLFTGAPAALLAAFETGSDAALLDVLATSVVLVDPVKCAGEAPWQVGLEPPSVVDLEVEEPRHPISPEVRARLQAGAVEGRGPAALFASRLAAAPAISGPWLLETTCAMHRALCTGRDDLPRARSAPGELGRRDEDDLMLLDPRQDQAVRVVFAGLGLWNPALVVEVEGIDARDQPENFVLEHVSGTYAHRHPPRASIPRYAAEAAAVLASVVGDGLHSALPRYVHLMLNAGLFPFLAAEVIDLQLWVLTTTLGAPPLPPTGALERYARRCKTAELAELWAAHRDGRLAAAEAGVTS